VAYLLLGHPVHVCVVTTIASNAPAEINVRLMYFAVTTWFQSRDGAASCRANSGVLHGRRTISAGERTALSYSRRSLRRRTSQFLRPGTSRRV